jgi:hypothetical protein
MADNVAITAGSGTTIGTDDIGGGVQIQRVKITWGVDGTATDASASNPVPVSGTFWQATQPVSLASQPLPTGASTSAKQPALGTAGTASTDVITVQGITSMTALKVDGSAVTQPVQVGKSVIISANFTRPADTTAYALGDLVANSTTAGSVTPLSFSNVVRVNGVGALVRKAKLRTGNTTLSNASFRIHFYATTETLSVGDNTAIVLPDTANYRGTIDITFDKAFSDGATGFGIPAVGDSILVNPASGTSLFAIIEARAAYVPTSAQVFTVELEILQD